MALEGVSGSGKTTVTRACASRFGWVRLPEAYERLQPVPNLVYRSEPELLRLEHTLLEEDARRWRSARTIARHGSTVVADTGFLGPVTYTAGLVELGRAAARTLRAVVDRVEQLEREGSWGLPDLVVYLLCPPALRHVRARADPVGHPPALQLRHEKVGAFEERFYRRTLGPLLGERFVVVRSDRSLERVVEEVRRAVASAREVPDPDPLGRAVLARTRGALLGSARPSAPGRTAERGRTVRATVKKTPRSLGVPSS